VVLGGFQLASEPTALVPAAFVGWFIGQVWRFLNPFVECHEWTWRC
jgi:hypothetical protein